MAMHPPCLLLILLLVFTPSALALGDKELTGNIGIEYGFTLPQGALAETLDTADTIRLRMFAGARFQQIKNRAFGLGLDLSHSNFPLHEALTGHYRRTVWDWLFLPTSIGLLELTPGISWVVTDIHIAEYDVRTVSIRPGLLLGLGFRLEVADNLALTGQLRIERVWEDRARVGIKTLPFETFIITGSYLSATFGIMAFL